MCFVEIMCGGKKLLEVWDFLCKRSKPLGLGRRGCYAPDRVQKGNSHLEGETGDAVF